MFYRLGLKIVARARVVLALSVVALVISAVLGIGAFARLLSAGFDDPASASSRANVLLDQKFGGDPDLIFLVHARSGTVDDPAVTAAGQALAQRLSTDTRLRGVTSYWNTRPAGLRSRDGTDALILAKVIGDEQTADKNAKALLADYAHLDGPDATVRIGGARGTDVAGQVGKDLALAEAIAVPITVVLMIIVFGSLVASLLPLAVGVLAIFATFAELDLLTHVTSVSVFAINLATGLGLGLGMDYALLMVSRFREELAKGVDVGDAVARTMATAGRTIAFSALAVAAALSAMLVFPVYFLKSFAYAGVGVTIFSAASALFVLPALLAVLGRRVNSGRIPGIRTVRSVEAPFWGRLAAGVMRRPLVAALPVVAVLLFLATPLLSVTFGTPDDRVLPTSAASHQVGDALRNDFAVTPDAIDVLLSPAVSPSALQGYAQQLSHLSGVQRADITVGSGGVQRVSLSTGLDAASGPAQDLVRRVRAVSAPPGTTVLVGGATATLIDAKHAISSHLLLAGALIVLTTFILLFLFTGSILQPLRALLGNTLTLGATLGVMVWIFQDGHFASVLGFTPRPTDTAMPVLLFCIAFGLSMDYELFVISRIKELHDAGVPNAEAVTGGLARTGRIVSTLAALLAVGFFAFGSSHVSFIQLFGLGTGLAILIDATLVRGVLVPAFMRAFGERSWYAPKPLRRIHNRIGVTENPPAETGGVRPVTVSG
ncbi:MMPL family transporter [Kribbella kalugense]|uniref:RND superfamily putative drug exporter n=1 Tax=Kribbella kalugense TaxID=2512221 RepID=A0A4R8A4L2_9ACTN|nr:MMPL family transporter [Kribbella kalugense]TDW24428.1 RND superfamily putative drug exporter [Kribbella kalugense]